MDTLSSPVEPSPETSPKTWRAGTLVYTTGGLAVLFCWLLWGDFAWNMKDRSVGPVLQALLHNFHASDWITGIIFSTLPAGIGLVLGPIISFRSDRHRGRWGRRIPFLVIPTPFTVLGMVGLAYSPVIGTWVHNWLGASAPDTDTCIIYSFGFFWTIFEIASIIAGTVYGALINDVVPQKVMGRFYGLFRALSLIAGILFNHYVFGHTNDYYVWIFLGMGTLYGVGFMMMCFNVKEGDYPDPLPMDKGRNIHGIWNATKTYFVECFGVSYYRWYFGVMAVAGMISGPVNLFTLYFSTDPSINMSQQSFGDYLAITYTCSLCLAYPLGWLADKIHPLRASIGAMFLYGLATLWGYLFIHDNHTFGIAFLLHGVLSGTYFTTSASIGQRLLPRAEFAQIGSAGGIIGSICGAMLGPGVGMFLDHFHHQYRYTFLMSSILSFVGVALLIVLYRKFVALGGPDNYKAPEPGGRNKRGAPGVTVK